MSEFFFNFIGFTLLGAVAIVLIMGIYTLFKGGSTSKKYSNKLMQLRVLLQFIAIIVLVLLAYFFKDYIYFLKKLINSSLAKSISPITVPNSLPSLLINMLVGKPLNLNPLTNFNSGS